MNGVRDNPEKYGFEGYRDWERWCNDELNISRRYANQFIKVYKEFGEDVLPKKGLQALYEIATLPPEQRDVPHELPSGETKKPEEMTVRELRELKRQLRQAEQEAEAERKERGQPRFIFRLYVHLKVHDARREPRHINVCMVPSLKDIYE